MSCSDCVNLSIGSVEFFDKAFPGGDGNQALPIAGSFELTLRCNVRCKHCYILYPGATDGEMNTGDCKRILDKLVDAGVVFLLLTGGEVLVRADFKELYLHAKRLGLILSIYTNATLINEDWAAFFRAYPPRIVETTIYGHSESVYEGVTGVRGSYQRFRKGVELLLDAGVNVSLKTIVLKSNQDEFEQMRDWAAEQGCRFRYDTTVNPKLDRSRDPLQERLSPQEVLRIDQLAPQAQERADSFRKGLQDVMADAPHENLFLCGTGIRTFHVDPTGMLHPCMLWRVNPFDLLHRDLDAEWRNHVHGVRSLQNPQGGCTGCSNRISCGRCPAQALLEMDDPTRNMPFHCEVTQERRHRFGEPASHGFDIR